jgi:hypothetical protein
MQIFPSFLFFIPVHIPETTESKSRSSLLGILWGTDQDEEQQDHPAQSRHQPSLQPWEAHSSGRVTASHPQMRTLATYKGQCISYSHLQSQTSFPQKDFNLMEKGSKLLIK